MSVTALKNLQQVQGQWIITAYQKNKETCLKDQAPDYYNDRAVSSENVFILVCP
jgi:hypothetical protein